MRISIMDSPITSPPLQASTSDQLLDAISTLEANTKHNIDTRRTLNRVGVNCPVQLQPGNSSDRDGTLTSGTCRDVSPSGCRLVMPQAMTVGDIYLIQLQDEQLTKDALFGRCIRCHMLREDKYECGISFLSPFSLDGPNQSTTGQLDLEI